MPDFFEFKRDNDYVRQRLTPDEIAGVNRWQSDRLNYRFSFHTQHEAGWPCYLSEPDGPKRNLPKVNLKVPTNPPVLLEPTSVVDNHAGVDFRDVIRANVPLFQKLARSYYEPTGTAETRGPTWVVVYKCQKASQAKPVGVRIPQSGQVIGQTFWLNFRQYAKAPSCPMHRNPDCMIPELTSIPANDVAKVTKRFDLNGTIEDIV
jgi:hypothetical protein